MRYVVSVMVMGMILALGISAALAEDCHGQGQYFRRPTSPPPGDVQTPTPPPDAVLVGSDSSPLTLREMHGENIGH